MSPPLVSLTSDFGTGSPYVAAMKARVLAGCPEAVLVDVSHSVPPFDISSAAFVVWAGTSEFPPGSVHLAVIDPGVGSQRRPVALEADGRWYVGPDNGIFGMLVAESRSAVRAVRLFRPAGASATFEGRDVFAPAAAALAAGRPPESIGTALESEPMALPPGPPSVLWVDNFGNLITSLRPPQRGVRVGGREVRERARTYSEAPPATPFFYVGSLGLIEVGVREGRAADLLGAGSGTTVEAL